MEATTALRFAVAMRASNTVGQANAQWVERESDEIVPPAGTMRTRSQTGAKNSITGKRKKSDHCAAHEDGAGRKRGRLSPPEASGRGMARHNSAGTKEGLRSPRVKKSVFEKRKENVKSAQDNGARDKQTHESPDQEMTNCSPAGTEIAEVPGVAQPTCRDDNLIGDTISPTPILALPAMAVQSSAPIAASKKQRNSSHTENQQDPVPIQDNSIEHCSSLLSDGNGVQSHEEHLHEQNTNCEAPTQRSEDFHEILESANLPPKLADTQCQPERGNSNQATPSLTQQGAEKGSCTASLTRKPVRLQSNSAGKNKQLKNVRRDKPMKSRKPDLKRIRAAELRWKHLMQSIVSAKFSPGSATVDDKLPHSGAEQTMSAENCQSNETLSVHKKRKRLVRHDSSSAARSRPKVLRQQQKIGKQLRRLLRWIKTWLIQANFSQVIVSVFLQ
ncbi:hypothetical protein GOP47_0001337 [Adiantum capillus-veneris]|uniref:Uncharacterized protein n=1 Tax=Adiantum capillus-veneris TaxID=13818 RepID=A0A9D4ZN48_ADICA|nr:hypothetical protein GOP47_0001337 [Adiantum capillus-veneris]